MRRSPRPPIGDEGSCARRWARGSRREEVGQPWRSANRLAMPDLRLAAWFLWMTPLLTALSSALLASCSAVPAAAASPDSAAVRTRRTAVFRADLTATLRWRARSLVRFRLIWDLMFATRAPRVSGGNSSDSASGRHAPQDRPAKIPASVPRPQPAVGSP